MRRTYAAPCPGRVLPLSRPLGPALNPAELLALGFLFGILAGVAAALYAVAWLLSRRSRKLAVRRMYETRRSIDVI